MESTPEYGARRKHMHNGSDKRARPRQHITERIDAVTATGSSCYVTLQPICKWCVDRVWEERGTQRGVTPRCCNESSFPICVGGMQAAPRSCQRRVRCNHERRPTASNAANSRLSEFEQAHTYLCIFPALKYNIGTNTTR